LLVPTLTLLLVVAEGRAHRVYAHLADLIEELGEFFFLVPPEKHLVGPDASVRCLPAQEAECLVAVSDCFLQFLPKSGCVLEKSEVISRCEHDVDSIVFTGCHANDLQELFEIGCHLPKLIRLWPFMIDR
jgi:hypothetical protein